MRLRSGFLIGGLIALQTPSASGQMRFENLERVYFHRVGASEASPDVPDPVRPLLPGQAPEVPFACGSAKPVEGPENFRVRDFPLPSTRGVWLREVVDSADERIHKLWWALYERGAREDVWQFVASPARNDGKMLGNYPIDSIALRDPDRLIARVQSEMSRPGGARSISGKEWIFDIHGGGLELIRVRNAFGFLQGYDVGGEAPRRDVRAEAESGGRLETRARDAVPESAFRVCGICDTWASEGCPFDWESMERVARCITAGPETAVTFRALDSRSFSERDR